MVAGALEREGFKWDGRLRRRRERLPATAPEGEIAVIEEEVMVVGFVREGLCPGIMRHKEVAEKEAANQQQQDGSSGAIPHGDTRRCQIVL